MEAIIPILIFSGLLRNDRLTSTPAIAIGIPIPVVGGSVMTWLPAKGDTSKDVKIIRGYLKDGHVERT